MRDAMKKAFLSLFLCAVWCSCGWAGVRETADALIYVPDSLDHSRKHPVVVALSPSADAHGMIEAWKGISERYQWPVLAARNYSNGGDMMQMLKVVARSVRAAAEYLPIDGTRVIATGISGGGMGAHAFAFQYPEMTGAVVVNTGMMHEYYFSPAQAPRYPRGKLAVFLASPEDFRYGEMKRDRSFLTGRQWTTKWIEFAGGHTMAPDTAYEEAAQWIAERI